MSDRNSTRVVNNAQTLMQEFPGGASTDTVVITIYNIGTNIYEQNQVAMTSVTGSLFKYGWTPSAQGDYCIDYWDETLDVHYYEYITVTDTLAA